MVDPKGQKPVLYILSGLPGSGKTTLAEMLARRLHTVFLRIDTIEQALRDLCAIEVRGEGYRLAYRVAADNLRLGMSVVADSCNPLQLTRREWKRVAIESYASYVNIQVVCSDHKEHRRRIEMRRSTVPGLRLPSWSEVDNREYERWTTGRIFIDTAGRTKKECFDELLLVLGIQRKQ